MVFMVKFLDLVIQIKIVFMILMKFLNFLYYTPDPKYLFYLIFSMHTVFNRWIRILAECPQIEFVMVQILYFVLYLDHSSKTNGRIKQRKIIIISRI